MRGNWEGVFVGLEAVPIDDDGLRAHLELIQGAVHGEDGGVEDIDLVDLLGGDNAYCPGKGVTLNDLPQLVSPLVGELLRVVQRLILIVGWEDYGRSIDTACQTATTCLVAACLDLALMIITL